MGRYTGPRTKISRRFGEPIFGPDKVLERRPNPPGQHGANKRRKKVSEYGQQLREKQKVKAIYGMREKQFRLFFERAKSMQGVTGENLLRLCETRLDNVIYRLGLAPTRAAARQLVTHRHVTVNGKVCGIPSYIVRVGEMISLKEKSRQLTAVGQSLEHHKISVAWLSFDRTTMTGSLSSLPTREEIPEQIDVQSIVELYSR
jgi:small subunit ribosomal protein S4